MSTAAIVVQVKTREETGTVYHDVSLSGDRPVLSDLLAVVAGTDWGARLFEQEPPLRMRPGHLLVLNGRMIQAWAVNDTPLADGDKLNFAPVVAGG